MRWSWVVLIAGALASAAAGDVVELNDGSSMEGTLKRGAGGWTVTDGAGRATFVADDRVKGIEKKSTMSAAEVAGARLAGVKRAVEALDDVDVIIKRYGDFMAQNKGMAAAEEAGRELAVWKERKELKLVKVGGKWVTVEERAGMLEKAAGSIEKIRELIKEARLRDAEAAVGELLALDPDHVSGLYLRGVLAYRQDKLADARKAFDRVRELLPDHGPTLNNIGVILSKQKQQLGALAFYDMALLASPKNRQVLDNVAEALQALPEGQKDAPSAKNAARHFIEQDTALQKELGEQGLFRWGSSYLTREKIEEVRAAEEKIKQRLDVMAEEYERTRGRIVGLERQIESNDRMLQQIDNDRSVIDSQGRLLQRPRPSIWYDIKRDTDRLVADKDQLVVKLAEFKEKARVVQQDTPAPAYTGVQRIVDVEGTPLAAPVVKGAATRPGGGG